MQKCSVAKFNIALAPVGVEPVDKSLKDTEDCGLQTVTAVIILLYVTEERTNQAEGEMQYK